ncbi:MAG: hypothetical protein FWC10_03610 [Lentimicrobiaceae bacterium]|nr:hypothetical protein [Lentimicrobiaceae bacterium]MCL2246182.1 hypothetical protein [Lentimicrobiaceae bacterium]
MARYTKEKTDKKRSQAKDMYVKMFDLETISDILGVSIKTLKRWEKEEDFEQARKSSYISLQEIRNTILESFADLRDGKTPKIKPDEAAKYASAFEKLSDKKKMLSYMYSNYELLTDELIKDVQNGKNKKEKEAALLVLIAVRNKTDIILTNTTAEALNDN